MKSRLRSQTWALGLVLILTAFVHAPGIVPALSGDDFVHVFRNRPQQTGWADLFLQADGREYRPLVRASLVLDGRLWNGRLEGYHLTNLALHLLNTALVFVWASATGLAAHGGLVAAAVFGLHPIHSYSVHAVMGRTDLLCTLFALAALLAAVRGSTLGAAGFTAGAVLSKESGLVVPLLAAAWYWLARRRRPQTAAGSAPHFRPVAASAAVACAYLILRWSLAPPRSADLAPYLQMTPAGLLKNLVLSMGALAVPAGHLQVRDWLERTPATVLVAAAGLLAVAAALLIWRFRIRWGHLPEPARLGLAWSVLSLTPYLSLFQRRFLYLSSAGFGVAVGGLLARISSSRLRYLSTVVLLSALAAAGLHSSLQWRRTGQESARLVEEIARQVAAAPADVWWVIDTPNGRGEAHLFTHDSLRYAAGLRLGVLPKVYPVVRLQLAPGSAPQIDRKSERRLSLRLRPELGEWFVFEAPELLDRGGRYLPVGTRCDTGPFRVEVTAADHRNRVAEISVWWDELPPGQRVLLLNERDPDGK